MLIDLKKTKCVSLVWLFSVPESKAEEVIKNDLNNGTAQEATKAKAAQEASELKQAA